jgi:hypothetical protein
MLRGIKVNARRISDDRAVMALKVYGLCGPEIRQAPGMPPMNTTHSSYDEHGRSPEKPLFADRTLLLSDRPPKVTGGEHAAKAGEQDIPTP